MSEVLSPESADQAYLPVVRLQRYVICMMLLSASVGLNMGMLIGDPSNLMLIVGGLGVTVSGLLIVYTGEHYSEVDSVIAGRDRSEHAFWYRIFNGD